MESPQPSSPAAIPVATADDRKIMIRIYAAFGAGLILSVVPHPAAALLSLVLVLGVLAYSYGVRRKTTEGSVLSTHMTFVIRTIWIGSALAVLTMIAGAAYLFALVDNTPLDPCIDSIAGIDPATLSYDMRGLETLFGSCAQDYLNANRITFILSGLIAAGPILLYFGVRFVRGFRLARRGFALPDPKAWL